MQNFVVPQSAIACSKLTIEETLEQGVSIGNLEQVNAVLHSREVKIK